MADGFRDSAEWPSRLAECGKPRMSSRPSPLWSRRFVMGGYANVYAYDDVLYVEPMRPGDVGLTNGPPYLRVAKGDGADAIGCTTREALDASTMPALFSPPPFLKWSGARSWSMFSKRSKLVGVKLEGDRIVVDAWAADGKGNHLPLMGQEIALSAAASDEDLGGAVVVALERSTAAPTR
jgi:hypothetical protein